MPHRVPPQLARRLILDELFALQLYQAFQKTASPHLQRVLDDLIAIEAKHVAFWQNFFKKSFSTLDVPRQLKFWCLYWLSYIFGEKVCHLALESIEIYGIRKYLHLWKQYKGTILARAIRSILEDEFQYEDEIISKLAERRIHPEKIRNIFLGFNDGLVEVLGAVSGFFAAFQNPVSVLVAGFTVAVAGSLSMAAGVYAAVSSENEVEKIMFDKARFFNIQRHDPFGVGDSNLKAAVTVGISYFIGSMIPVIPVFFGSKSVAISLIVGALCSVAVSFVVSFLSGMDMKRRIGINLAAIVLAVVITYGIGIMVQSLFF